jgi:hypothetical protein
LLNEVANTGPLAISGPFWLNSLRMTRLITILSAILALTLRTPAQAAEFNVEWVDPKHTGARLTIKGELELKDIGSFRAVAKELAYAPRSRGGVG